jgi:hypothetical protein
VLRRLAGVDASCAFPTGVAHVKLAADTEVTFHFAMPGGETPVP